MDMSQVEEDSISDPNVLQLPKGKEHATSEQKMSDTTSSSSSSSFLAPMSSSGLSMQALQARLEEQDAKIASLMQTEIPKSKPKQAEAASAPTTKKKMTEEEKKLLSVKTNAKAAGKRETLKAMKEKQSTQKSVAEVAKGSNARVSLAAKIIFAKMPKAKADAIINHCAAIVKLFNRVVITEGLAKLEYDYATTL
jgi:hypothetical protein